MHKLVVISVMPLGQAVTTDWDSPARWLRIPQLTGRKKNRSWLDIQTVWLGQLRGLQQFRTEPCNGAPAQNHRFVLTCGPVPHDILQDLSFLCPAYRKLRKNLICFAFCFLIQWKWGPSLLFLFENLHAATCVFSPFPTGLRKPSHTYHSASTFISPLDVISKPQLRARLPEGSRQALQGHQDWQNCSRSSPDLEMKVERKPLGAHSWEHLSGLLNAGRESLSCTDYINKAIFTMLSYLLSHWNYKTVAVPENWEIWRQAILCWLIFKKTFLFCFTLFSLLSKQFWKLCSLQNFRGIFFSVTFASLIRRSKKKKEKENSC